MGTMFELCSCSGAGIFAIPYRAGLRRKATRLPDGAIVESPSAGRAGEVPARPGAIFEVAVGGGPATIHHANLGLVSGFLPLTGVFLLPSGEVAAVYGAVALPIGDHASTVR